MHDLNRRQVPLGSGFGPRTTALDVLGDRRLDGLRVVITGGSAGVGLETTRALASAGAHIRVGARSQAKAQALLAEVANVEVDSLDLADPASIDAFAARSLASGHPVHVLLNNAGIMATPLSRNGRGFESQLATNHLGHFQLTARLWPALVAARGARVVSLSSRAHARNAVDLEDPHFLRRPYDKWVAYAQSKTANALFAVALDSRGSESSVRAFSVHPGVIIETDISRSLSPEEVQAVVETARKAPAGFKSVAEGAATSVWCATSRQLDGRGGVYCEDCDIAMAVPADHPDPGGVRPWARDPEIAERLWRASEVWTGVQLGSGKDRWP
jgi:NAD(P)-dependent dehydrogenase (short-subunit alcohol dehydrogenase family)